MIFDSHPSLDRLWDEVDRLNMLSYEPSPFLTSTYLKIWDRCFSHALDKQVVMGRANNSIKGLAAFYRRESPSTYFMLGGKSLSDRLGFIVEEGYEEEFVNGFVSFIRGGSALSGSDLVVNNLNGGTPVSDALVKAAGPGRGIVLKQVESSPYMSLPGTFEEYLGLLSGKKRHELRRKIKRAGENLSGIEVEVERGGDKADLEGALGEFIRLHSSSNIRKLNFWKGKRREFFYGIASEFGRSGWLKILFLRDNNSGNRVASLMLFDFNGEYLLYNSGFDPAYRKSSPGLVLIARSIEMAIEEKRRRFDFLRGEEKYKYDLGGVDRPVFRVEFKG